MEYKNIKEAIFLKRINRFEGFCLIDGVETRVHIKNTGRCKELLIKGTKVYVEKYNSPKRKLPYSLVTVIKGTRFINMDSSAPNISVYEALKSGKIDLNLGRLTLIKPETKYMNSRFDFYAETENDKIFIEVKGVTLEKNNIALFPDAPSIRGVKHIKELISALSEGYKAFIIFVIQMKDPAYFTPNKETHKEFADMLKTARDKGVSILAYDCCVNETKIEIEKKIPIIL